MNKRNSLLSYEVTKNRHFLMEGGGVGDTMVMNKKVTNRIGEILPRNLNGVTGHANYNQRKKAAAYYNMQTLNASNKIFSTPSSPPHDAELVP